VNIDGNLKIEKKSQKNIGLAPVHNRIFSQNHAFNLAHKINNPIFDSGFILREVSVSILNL